MGVRVETHLGVNLERGEQGAYIEKGEQATWLSLALVGTRFLHPPEANEQQKIKIDLWRKTAEKMDVLSASVVRLTLYSRRIEEEGEATAEVRSSAADAQ